MFERIPERFGFSRIGLEEIRFFRFGGLRIIFFWIWRVKVGSFFLNPKNIKVVGATGRVGMRDGSVWCLRWFQTPRLPKITSWLKSYRPILISTQGGRAASSFRWARRAIFGSDFGKITNRPWMPVNYFWGKKCFFMEKNKSNKNSEDKSRWGFKMALRRKYPQVQAKTL